MAFDGRLQQILLGFVVGCIVGYLVRLIQDIQKDVHDVKEELDEVDLIMKRIDHDNEGGYLKISFTALAALLVVGLAFYASIVSQNASDSVKDSQDRTNKVVSCNKTVLGDTLIALDERSTYSADLAAANIDLQQAQYDFFTLLAHKPPYSEKRRTRAFLAYVDAQRRFLDLAKKSREKLVTHPFPTIEDFSICLKKN